MTRPVTLFTGQWADLPLEDVNLVTKDWSWRAGATILRSTKQSRKIITAMRNESYWTVTICNATLLVHILWDKRCATLSTSDTKRYFPNMFGVMVIPQASMRGRRTM